MDELEDQFGAEAYGVYWHILEDIAASMEPGKMEPTATHSVVKWASICRSSARKWRSIAKKMSDLSLIVVNSTGDRFSVTVPNIMKYKDEYARKSGVTPDKVYARADTDTDREQIRTLHAKKPRAARVKRATPETASAVKTAFPAADAVIIRRIVNKARIVAPEATDLEIAAAVHKCRVPGQEGPGLFLITVPKYLTRKRARDPTPIPQKPLQQELIEPQLQAEMDEIERKVREELSR